MRRKRKANAGSDPSNRKARATDRTKSFLDRQDSGLGISGFFRTGILLKTSCAGRDWNGSVSDDRASETTAQSLSSGSRVIDGTFQSLQEDGAIGKGSCT